MCNHEPDFECMRPADGAPGVLDVPCLKCGILGSVRVPCEDIQWEECAVPMVLTEDEKVRRLPVNPAYTEH